MEGNHSLIGAGLVLTPRRNGALKTDTSLIWKLMSPNQLLSEKITCPGDFTHPSDTNTVHLRSNVKTLKPNDSVYA